MNSAIVVNNISKKYRIGKGLTSIKDLFSFQGNQVTKNYRWVVKDVSFDVPPGDSLGIIGPNGAGKTTILKMLSRVTQPTKGEINVNGRLSALIELGAGFHPDLTGRENIFLNGTILGMKRAEIRARFDEIVDFAGIGDFLDTPVKRYSSGMYARIGFAIAAHVNPRVLLVDEVLAVGDFAFQTKCYSLMEKLIQNGTAMILVSHNMDAIRRVCKRGLVMYRGEGLFLGTSSDAIVAYSDAIRKGARNQQIEIPKENGISERIMSFDAEILKVSMRNENGSDVTSVPSGSQVRFVLDVIFNKNVEQPIFSLIIRTIDGRIVYDTTTRWLKFGMPNFTKGEHVSAEFSVKLPLLSDTYEVSVDITSADLSHFYDYLESAMSFSVYGTDAAKGLVDLEADFSIKPS